MFKIEDTIFYEKINYNKLTYIINNKDKYKDIIEPEEKVMKRNKGKIENTASIWSILKKIHNSCQVVSNTEYGYIPVTYKKGKSSNNIGRWYADKGIGLAPICSCVRHTICDNIWIDIDQVNSHPTIMKSFMTYFNFNSPLLNKCFENREDFLKTIMNEEQCNRDEAKTCVISVINGGKYKTPTLKQLTDELKPCINHVIKLDEYKDIYDYCKKEYSSNLSNLNGKIISRILQVIENNLLECYIEFCLNKDVIPKYKDGYQVCLIFDGFQLINNPKINDEFIDEMRKYAYDKTGYDVPLKIKPFDNKLDLPTNYYEDDIVDLAENERLEQNRLKKIEDQKNLISKGYNVVKEEFEKTVCKVMHDGSFIRDDYKINILSRDKLAIIYSNLWCYIKNPKTGEIEKDLFFKNWLLDENMRTVRGITFDPSRSCPNDLYNKFTGFRAETLPPVDDEDVDDLIRPILNHYKDVLYGDDWEYGVELDRQLVKNPAEKTGVILVIKGPQGAVKSAPTDILMREKIIGTEYASQCGGITPLFQRFETLTPNKILCLCDEVSILEVFKDKTMNEKLKNLATSLTTDWENKGINAITIPNHINIRITSNNDNPISIPPDDRRFCVFECKDTHLNDPQYVPNIIKVLQDDRVARAYYQYLMKGDLKYKNTYEFQKNRPLTSYYKNVIKANLDPFDRFLSYVCINKSVNFIDDNDDNDDNNNIDDDNDMTVQAFKFYNDYKAWCLRRKWDVNTTSTNFGNKLRKITSDSDNVISKKRTDKYVTYIINTNNLKSYLISKNRFDEDIY